MTVCHKPCSLSRFQPILHVLYLCFFPEILHIYILPVQRGEIITFSATHKQTVGKTKIFTLPAVVAKSSLLISNMMAETLLFPIPLSQDYIHASCTFKNRTNCQNPNPSAFIRNFFPPLFIILPFQIKAPKRNTTSEM